MKKIMFMFAAVVMAVSAQAAVAMTWQTGSGVKDVNGADFTATTTGYTATILFFTDSACTTPFAVTGNTSTKYTTKGSAGFNGKTSESFEAGVTYYSKITITEDATGKTYTSDAASFSLPVGATAGVTMNFTSGLNIGGSSKLGTITYTGGSDPGGVPEPTSGILLLVGGAMLALRRKQK